MQFLLLPTLDFSSLYPRCKRGWLILYSEDQAVAFAPSALVNDLTQLAKAQPTRDRINRNYLTNGAKLEPKAWSKKADLARDIVVARH